MPQSPSYSRQLFHGEFNSGQSKRARDIVCDIAAAGARDILYVVANATARSAVRSELVARSGAMFGLRVVSFRGLPIEIERRARVKGAGIAGGIVNNIIVERAVQQAAHNVSSQIVVTGLASAAAATIAEVEHGGATVSSLADALDHVVGDGARILLDTWKELERLRGSRVRSLAGAQRSATDLLRIHTATLLDACSLIVLEDLPIWGPVDRDLISALLAAAQCPVIATSEYASQLPSAPAMMAHELLRALAEWEEELLTRATDSLGGAGTNVFSVPYDRHEGLPVKLEITRLEAAGETGEVRLAARVILRHLRDATMDRPIRGSDILVIARGRRYRKLIGEIFAQNGIGVDTLPSRSASESALGSVLIDLLELATDANGGTRDQALGLLRTPHLDLGGRAADRLERQVVRRGYLELAGWDERALHGLGKRGTGRVNRLKSAIAIARQLLAVAKTHQDMAGMVRRLAKELRLVGNAYFARHRIMKNESHESLVRFLGELAVREDNKTWEAIEKLLDDTMPELLHADTSIVGRSELSFPEKWLALFARALVAESKGQTLDGENLVRIAGTSNGDGQPARITIILGLRQQAFPRQARQNSFLPDSLRDELRKRGIAISTSEETADRERESFVRAISTAKETLYLSYPATDTDGKPAVASFFLEDLQRAVGVDHQFGVERLGVANAVPAAEDAASQSELFATIAHDVWQRLPVTARADANRASSIEAWNELVVNSTVHSTAHGAVNRIDGIGPISNGRVAQMRPLFERKILAHAPHTTLELSASQLKTIQHCTFQHFVEKVLRPADLSAPEYGALTRGSLVHEAMVRWVKLDGWRRGEAALGELDRWFTARAAKLPLAARSGTLTQFTIEEDRMRLAAFVTGELDAVSGPEAAHPTYNELAFGARAAKRHDCDPASLATTFDLPIHTSIGDRTVKFTGSIDRVDVYHVDSVAHGIALDYKTGATSSYYADAMEDGSDLQVRLYLLALERLWNIKPMGALYLGFGDGIRRGAISEDAVGRIGEFNPKCVSVMPVDAWDEFVHAGTERMIQPLIERLVTFDIIARPHKGDCGFCELGPICRYTSHAPGITDA